MLVSDPFKLWPSRIDCNANDDPREDHRDGMPADESADALKFRTVLMRHSQKSFGMVVGIEPIPGIVMGVTV